MSGGEDMFLVVKVVKVRVMVNLEDGVLSRIEP